MRLNARIRPARPLLVLLLPLMAACAPHGGKRLPVPEPADAAQAAPGSSEEPAPDPGVDDAIVRSEEAYQHGLDAYRAGDYETARSLFEECLRILAEADPTFDGDTRVGLAYRNYWENIQDLESQRVGGEVDSGPAEDLGTPADDLEEVSPEIEPEEQARELGRAEEAAAELTYDIPMELNESVLAFVDLYTGEWRDQFEAAFRRSGRYIDMMRRTFAEEGVPQDLAYMAHVESGYKIRALSRARAYGLWQFMAATGRNYGLQRDYWVDERADPEKATRAAARYLKFLHEMFGDWHLAMAAYNAGEYKVQRGLNSSGVTTFWELRKTRYLRRETKNFVPAILAAVLIHRSPEKYGFDPAEREEPMQYDVLRVDSQTDFNVLAQVSGAGRDELQWLNPELRRNATPPDVREYLLRVPAGRGEIAQAKLDAVPKNERVQQVVHVVRRGDTLSQLATRYGTSIHAIQTANHISNPRHIRVGSTLIIPLSGAAPPTRTAAQVDTSTGLRVHTVGRGENPYVISKAYRLRLDDLLAWNGLTRSSIIYPGTKLYVQDPGARTPVRTASTAARVAPVEGGRTHVVRRGETPAGIARHYGVGLAELLAWNGLTRTSVIYPGQRLVIGGGDGGGGGGDAVAEATYVAESTVYVVKRGDTLYDISRAHAVTVSDLCRWNGISSRSILHPGDRLQLHP